MKNKNAERIWKNTKSTIDSVQSFMKLMKRKATSDEEWARLSNLELPWHFKDHIIKREQKFLKDGGKLIFPLPDIEIV